MLKRLNKFQDKTIAIIPARGGSSRIKDKNLQKIGNLSLIKNTLIECKKSKIFDEIIVSTDSHEISNESIDLSTLIHNRSKLNSSSVSTTESVISEIIIDFEELFKNNVLVYLIQCTSPFITSKDLTDSFKLIIKDEYEYDSLFSGFYTKKFIWKRNLLNNSWIPTNYEPNYRPRSQEKEALFIENGAFYVFGSSNFQLTNCRLHGNVDGFEMEEIRSLDIDNQKDLDYAIFLAGFLRK